MQMFVKTLIKIEVSLPVRSEARNNFVACSDFPLVRRPLYCSIIHLIDN
jgi:hypothetical protein